MALSVAERDLLLKLWNDQGRRCYYCGRAVNRKEWKLDRKNPRGRSDAGSPRNLAVVCPACKASKGDRTEPEYREWLAERKRWLSEQYQRYLPGGGERKAASAA